MDARTRFRRGGLAMLALALAASQPAFAENTAANRQTVREALRASAGAARALAGSRPDAAVALAERAVLLAPGDAANRALLGRSYLRTGRFASARAALAEALELNPRDNRAALDLALAQAAGGDGEGARATLDAHAAGLSPTDLGLALALSGAPEAGARLLLEAARQPGADARTRQNLALALALGGDWHMARVIAAADVSPDKLDRRIADWALVAHPGDPTSRVARFLGVAPVIDPGRPAVLALRPESPVLPAPSAPAAVAVAAVPPALSPAGAAAVPVASVIRFAARQEVVQALPRRGDRSDVPLPRPGHGRWYVQIGAYGSEGVARNGWLHARRRMPAFAAFAPTGTPVRRGGRTLFRLAVGGFDQRRVATDTCERYREAGGRCFVRTYAGDQLADWLRGDVGDVQVAAR